MLLNVRRWGEVKGECIVCVHGLTQHGGVFEALAERLVQHGYSVLSVDLRGHGRSGHEPPWNTESHVRDLLETLASRGVDRVLWIGHSFGGRVVAAAAAASEGQTDALVLLDPGLGEVRPAQALQGAELDRLDWSFETPAGAINALLSGNGAAATSRERVVAYAEEDLRRGADGRYRFSFCPSAVVTAWGEMSLPVPSIVAVPTLVVCVEGTLFTTSLRERYRAHLGSRLSVARVPNGHNVLWESAEETAAAIEDFLGQVQVCRGAQADPIEGYLDATGLRRPLL
jgi:lipase